jgi:PKD repeat protein
MKFNSYSEIKTKDLKTGLLILSMTCFAVIGSFTPSLGQSFDPSPYCDIDDSDCNNGFDPKISSVTFGDFSNTSGCGTQDGVSYYESLDPISICVGSQVTGTVKTPGADYDDHALSIWIDYDQDGTFSPSEQVYDDLVNVPSGTETGTHNVSFQVPNSAKKGVTRMRIEVAEDDRIPDDEPCEASHTFEDGEIEDYKVEVGPQSTKPDLRINKLVEPKQSRNQYGIEPVKVEIENRSTQTVSANTPIPFEVNTTLKPKATKSSVTLDQPLSSCETRIVTVDTVGLKCDKGGLNLSVIAQYGPDVNASNDTVKANFPIKPIDLNFSSGTFPSTWSRDATNQVQINSNCSSSGGFSLLIDGVTGTTVTSPVFDLSNSPQVSLSFAYREAENCGGENPDFNEGIALEYYNGNTWQEVARTNGNNDIRSFTEVNIVIDQGLTDQFQLRARVYAGTGDDFDSWLIDDIELEDPREATSSPRLTNLINGPDTIYANSPIYEFRSLSGTGVNEWSLDGSIADRKSNAISVEYRDTGKDTIQLVTAGCFGLDTATKIIDIVQPQRSPRARFFADQNYVDTNETVKLQDLSEIGPNKWQWRVEPMFRNGDTAVQLVDGSLTGPSADLEFTQPGKYSVSLVVSNSVGSSRLVKTDYIVVSEGYRMCADSNYTTNPRGFVYDDGGPSANYPDNQNQTCRLLIEPECTNSIDLVVEKLDLVSTSCNANPNPDFLKVYDGKTTSGKALHTAAGYPDGFTNSNFPGNRIKVKAESGAMLLVYSKNGCGDAGSGFTARWNANRSADSGALAQLLKSRLTGPDTIFAKSGPDFSVQGGPSGSKYNWMYPENEFAVTGTRSLGKPFDVNPGKKMLEAVTRYCGVTDTNSKSLFVEPITQKPKADFTASSTSVTLDDTVQLFDQTDEGVAKWKWEFGSPSVVEFVKGSDANSINPYVTFSSAGDYRVDLIATNPQGQDVEAKINYIQVKRPCIPAVNDNNSDLAINEFRIATINNDPIYTNSSQYGSNGFTRYQPKPSVELEGGKQYIITVRRNSSFNDIDVGAWIDLNGDLEYSTNEQLMKGSNVSGPRFVDTVRIPNNFNGPIETGLRVATNFGGNGTNGCGPHAGGEFEQYQVQLINDLTPPVITLDGRDTLQVDPCSMAPDTGAVAIDGVDGNISRSITIENIDLLGVEGTHTLTYRATDQSGNTATKNQVINVDSDTTKPTLSLKGTDSVGVALNDDYSDNGVTVTDPCSNIDTVLKSGNVNESVVGSYRINYTAIDNQGNSNQIARTVTVFDPIGPSAELLGQDTVRIAVNSDFRDPGVQSSDNYLDSTIVRVSGSVNEAEVGVYNLNYNVFDVDQNSVKLERVVIVEDNIAPSITGIPSGAIIQDVNKPFTFPFSVSDNYYDRNDLSVEEDGSFYQAFPDGFPDSLGFYKAQLAFTDGSGNTDSVTVAVRVVDKEAPDVQLITSSLVSVGKWKTYDDSLGVTFKVSDNYYNLSQLSVSRTGSYFDDYLSADSSYPTGLYQIQYQAEDPSGNKASVTRGVQVSGNTGLRNKDLGMLVDIYPNPSKGPVSVRFSNVMQTAVTVEVINGKGQTVRRLDHELTGKTNDLNLDLGDEAKGLYKVKVQTSENVVTKSLIIQ